MTALLPLPLLLLLLALLATAQPAHADDRVERRLASMGTALTVTVDAPDRATALVASEAAVRAVEAVEVRLSTWRTDSELSQLNQAPVGTWVPLSSPLAEDLALVAWCHQQTAGAFDPAVGALVDAWGLRTGGRTPDQDELTLALASTGLQHLELDGLRARRRADIRLDAGGFGKGIALDAGIAAALTAGATAVVLDLGGQLAVHQASLSVGIADPGERQAVVDRTELSSGSLATSGHSEHPGHLLDPRTGYPARDFGTVTVWAPSAAVADCLSTGLSVLGPAAARRWVERHPDLRVILTLLPGEAR